MLKFLGRFVWYELVTTDMEAAKAFYTKVVGWDTRDASTPGRPYTLFTDGKAWITGLMDLPEYARQTRARPTWIGYIGVDDVDATADRIKHLGGTVHVPPQEIPDISRFAVVADAQMATFGLTTWLTPDQQQLADLGAPGRFGWHELLAIDREKAWAFYGELFGWQKTDADISAPDAYWQFSVAGQAIGGMYAKPVTVPADSWLYYLNIGDIDAAAQRVKAGGGQILDGPLELPGGGWIVQCMDPQGAIFALQGRRGRKAIGYFERAPSRDPSDTRSRRWYW